MVVQKRRTTGGKVPHMNMVKLGDTGIEISKIGLGTWAIGGGPAWNGDLDTQVCIDTIHKAQEVGINLIDTADIISATAR